MFTGLKRVAIKEHEIRELEETGLDPSIVEQYFKSIQSATFKTFLFLLLMMIAVIVVVVVAVYKRDVWRHTMYTRRRPWSLRN